MLEQAQTPSNYHMEAKKGLLKLTQGEVCSYVNIWRRTAPMSEWDVVVPGGVRQWFYVFFMLVHHCFGKSFLSINLIKCTIMKNILCLLAFLPMFVFTACSSDDDDANSINGTK